MMEVVVVSILRVNMSSLTIQKEQVKAEYEFLGGRALIARILLDEVKPTCEPLGKHNKLIYATGLLGGSKVYSSGRISIGGKSPLTGGAMRVMVRIPADHHQWGASQFRVKSAEW